MARRDKRREQTRRARRLWRHYEPPDPGQVVPEPDAPEREASGGWSPYRRRVPKVPVVAKVPTDQVVARAGEPWTPPRQRRQPTGPDDADAGKPITKDARRFITITVLLVGVIVWGIVDSKRDPTESRRPDGPHLAAPLDALDPRTLTGHVALVDLLTETQGNARITWVLLHSDSALIGALTASGTPITYYRYDTVPVLVPIEEKERTGVPFDLARIDPQVYAPLLARMSKALDIGTDDVDVTIQHQEGTRTWFRITGASDTHTGVLLADRKGAVISERLRERAD